MLLEGEDINPNQADATYGRSGHHSHKRVRKDMEVVKMVLELENINLNQAGTEYGRTPL